MEVRPTDRNESRVEAPGFQPGDGVRVPSMGFQPRLVVSAEAEAYFVGRLVAGLKPDAST